MIKFLYYKNVLCLFILLLILFFPYINSAKEILIYADNISYDKDKNIIARGNAKIFLENQFIFSDLIIYEKNNEQIILPTEFTLKDNKNNFFRGSKGKFDKNLNFGEINDVKIKLNDGSRIIGNSARRSGDIDIITKGVYSPCKSRIKIANFICPTWQLEGEKILHDNKNLFLYQKHSKMRILNTPVFYIPYIVTPSPLRKERKSGFLTPSISFNFFDTKTAQSTSFPYYFNIAQDKELTFTPILKYGGGIDSSQRFIFDYNQIISGGNFNTDITFDSNLEKQNNNKWVTDASIITNYNKNLNKNFHVNIESALQTSNNYIQKTIPDSELSYTSSLSSKFNLSGYNLHKIDDELNFNVSFYQSSQQNEDNKTTPMVLPLIEYYSGNSIKFGQETNNHYTFYNIIRDTNTSIHAKNQQKISNLFSTSKEFIKKHSKIQLESNIYTQFYNTEKKLIDTNKFHTGTYFRVFPALGISAETPFKIKSNIYNLVYNPKIKLIITPGQSNSNKISNEDSSNNSFTINNISSLNRFSGSDKLDNSKRLNYGINIYNDKINLNLSQIYEFTDNSNFHKEEGNDDNLSDLLGTVDVNNNKYNANYNFRYDFNDNFLKKQSLNIKNETILGDINLSYLDQKSKVDNIINTDTETFNYSFKSKKINKFSSINISGIYDLKKEINTEYSLGYSYFDECFGINLDFKRKSYEEDDLKPQDILTIMFSFKNIGSYKSSNLAVSENDKQDIEWLGANIDNEKFINYEN
tara:strand:+ start:1718 stop:3976 length:2259 start_codon:yes stop_codon:yes gene_type:complete